MLFEEQISRKPDKYPWTEDYMRAMWDGHWTDKEFSFQSDIQDFKVKLTPQEKEIIVRTLSAIGQIEIAVKTFWAKLGDNLPHPSVRDMGYVMANVEVIHNNAYERLLEVLGLEKVFEENLKLDWITGRVNYLRKYTHKYYKDNKKQFIYALILFTLFVENVSLFSQFYVINWFGRRNLLKDTNQQTSYTLKEELIHGLVGIKIINTLRQEYPELFDKDLEERVKHEAEQAYEAEAKIIDWMVNGIQDPKLSAPILKEFVKKRINESLVQIGYSELFALDKTLTDKTLWFDEELYGNGHTDFFYARPRGIFAEVEKLFSGGTFLNNFMTRDYYWLNEDSRTFLERGYLGEGITPEQRIRQIAENAESYLQIKGFADKFEGYMKRGFYSLATPVWTNFGNSRGLPVSCFNSYVDDTIDSIIGKLAEIGVMSKYGGGTSAYFGDVRPRGANISVGGKSSGPVHFMEMYNVLSNVISQGSTRRGTLAVYLPLEHPDIKEFLAIRSGGHPIQHLNIGVTVGDKWLQEMIDGDVQKQEIWLKVIKKRFETGYPYVFFTDTVNKNKPEVYKEKGYTIYSSNVCSEIALPSKETESFVCVLSSLNLVHWDEIVQTDAIETLIYFLDTVNEEFVRKTVNKKFMGAAHEFAKNHRALGLGVLGWHSLLQSKMIPFEGLQAQFLNSSIFKTIQQRTLKASQELAVQFGEPEVLKGYGRRNTALVAIAPTTSSSFILGQVSQSIEPLNSNYFVKKMDKGNFTYKNPYLIKLLEEKGQNTEAVWSSILVSGGSVQHLSFLSTEEKDVFKTFGEISQLEIAIQASQRQKYIDQAQSLNFMIHPNTPVKEVNQLMLEAWRLGVKTLYYQRGVNPSQELSRSILSCKACEA